MPEELYPATETAEVEETETVEKSPAEETEESTESNTALVPKSLFGSHECKVGDTYTFKVAGIYDDEVELAPVKEDKESNVESKIEAMATESEE